MGSFSIAHWIVVIVVLLLIFGPKRLAEVGKGLGEGIRGFKSGIKEDDAKDAPKLPEKGTRDTEGEAKS